MNTVLIIAIFTCVGLIMMVLFKPSITVYGHTFNIYWIIVLTGAVILVAAGYISPEEVWRGLTADTAINPIKILVLFISMTMLSIYLDEAGFFKYLAVKALRKAKSRQIVIFLYVYILVSVLTVFTSNDIIILTFTPFICYFSKHAGINPVPYLFAEFVAANTWSMMLVIGNPTNVYLATANNIDFLEYTSVMLLPTIGGGVTALLVLLLVFRRMLVIPIEPVYEQAEIKDTRILAIGIIHLGVCTILLIFSSYLNIEMWLISMSLAISLFLMTFLYHSISRRKGKELYHCLRRAPWELIPFILSMFVLVLALDKYGITSELGKLLLGGKTVFKYGLTSFISANVINNIPMSVLFSSVTQTLEEGVKLQGVYAAVAGSNIGAFFTPLGALAGIMWTGILKHQNVRFSFLDFIKYGVVIAIPTLLVTLVVLQIYFA